MKQKTKIDYCKCHNSLKDDDKVTYRAFDTERTIYYDGTCIWQQTSIVNDVIFNCNKCGKQMPEKVEDVVFKTSLRY